MRGHTNGTTSGTGVRATSWRNDNDDDGDSNSTMLLGQQWNLSPVVVCPSSSSSSPLSLPSTTKTDVVCVVVVGANDKRNHKLGSEQTQKMASSLSEAPQMIFDGDSSGQHLARAQRRRMLVNDKVEEKEDEDDETTHYYKYNYNNRKRTHHHHHQLPLLLSASNQLHDNDNDNEWSSRRLHERKSAASGRACECKEECDCRARLRAMALYNRSEGCCLEENSSRSGKTEAEAEAEIAPRTGHTKPSAEQLKQAEPSKIRANGDGMGNCCCCVGGGGDDRVDDGGLISDGTARCTQCCARATTIDDALADCLQSTAPSETIAQQRRWQQSELQEPKRKLSKPRKVAGSRSQSHHVTPSTSTSSSSLLSFQHKQCGTQMVLASLADLVFIYIVITSSLLLFQVPFARATGGHSYWPQRKSLAALGMSAPRSPPQLQQQQQHQQEQQHQETNAGSMRHQLMIGQHYSNFSSIVPYSIVQDSDYTPIQEDQLMEEQTPEEQAQFQQQPFQLPPQDQHQQQQQQQQQQHRLYPLPMGSSDSSRSDRDQHQEAKSRALLPLDSNRLILPQMQQIKSRFNQGCVGGTKCQFFAFCWMSGGSLGASCGLLMTCCVTPSRQEIQPGFYGPVVNDPYCGRSKSKINRIVGGTDASFGQFPWQAFVQVGGSRCGGALISSRHVVTAGHCVARSQHSPSSIKVTLGDYILNSDIESIPHEVFSVVEVLLHPNFRFTPQADRYDVAVLELDRTASYKDNIKPICLPQKDAAFVGRVAFVAGWGALQAGSKLRPKVLQHVAVPVIENQVCESWHRRKGIDIRIYDEMMCAGYELGQRDACQGDSGGPLMLNHHGVWYLVGIVSAGYSCAKQYQPGIYHRVSSSSDWISSNVYQQGANK